MGKKLQRVFRNRFLTPEEVASDAQVREKVQREFPPKRSSTVGHSSSISDLLKQSIRESNRSAEEIASDAGVSPILVTRFLSGECDIHMTTADKLADSLGLKLAAE